MRKLLLLVSAFSMLLSINVWAQERTVSGQVTAAEDGSSLPGVNVVIKGTSNGAVTDIDGNFKLSVSEGATLVFSFIGLETNEVIVGNRTVIDVQMASDVQQLGEVVVTALGVQREKKTLGYATQEVKAEDLRVARESNLNQALAGKIAGVQVVSGSGAKFGAASIRIRGVRGLSASSPLYVVDGIVMSDASNINMDNVESINVLKGANASALYGSRGRDGVIMITSKTAKKGDMTIDFNSTTTFENVSTLLPYQNEYGGGYDTFAFNTFSYNPAIHDPALAGLDGVETPEFYADESWGPALNGQMVAHWDAFTPGTAGFGQLRPWEANPDNVKNFFNTGVSLNNSLSIGKAGDDYTMNVTISNSNRTGVMPNTGQDRTFLNMNATIDLSDKFKMIGMANYNQTETLGNLFEGYNSIGSNVNQWFQRQLDMDLLEQYYQLPNGDYSSWNINSASNTTPLYWDNPFTTVFANESKNTKEVFFGKFGLSYELMDGLSVAGNISRASQSYWSESTTGSGTLDLDGYRTFSRVQSEDNYELNANYDKQINEDFSVKALIGGNLRFNEYSSWNLGTAGGLTVPHLYNLSASTDRPTASNTKRSSEMRSIYGQANIGFRETVFLDYTNRIDWDSRGPALDNSFDYWSVSSSFIFSEVLPSQDILSFGKVRVGYAEVGGELSAYQLAPTYSLGTPYNGVASMAVPNSSVDANLRAAVTSSIEAGVELGFLNNRIKADFSYYVYDNSDEIVAVGVPGTSGVASFTINSGKTTTKGWDATLSGTPVKGNDLNWDVSVNFAQSNNYVDELYPGLDAYSLSNGWRGTGTTGGWGGITAKAQVGEEWGTIIGRKFQRDADGNQIVSSSGRLLYDENEVLGKILPDFTGGMFNRVSYKNFDLSFTMDWQIGGKFHSISKMFGAYSGLTSETVGDNDLGNPMRDAIADGGGLKFDAVKEDGTPNDIYLTADAYWKSLFGRHERWLYDATFVKVREVRLGYSLPASMLSGVNFLNRASIAVVANNPWLIYTAAEGIDPSEISGDTQDARSNGAWVESGNLPPTRSIGFDIKLGF